MTGDLSATLEQMRRDWDSRARENARHYVHTGKTVWTDAEFFKSGEEAVQGEILEDSFNVFQGKEPRSMRVLEIGCGAGRITRALANVFGEVHAVDISGEMVRQAKAALRDRPNAFVYQNNGMDLKVLPAGLEFDFAFSYIVFQHIPSLAVIESYVREVHRVLRPGALFKFQVQGWTAPGDRNTWTGVPISEDESLALAERCGFEPRYGVGAGTQYFWLWYFKQDRAQVRYVAASRRYALAIQRARAAILIVPAPSEADVECFRRRLAEEEAAAEAYRAAREEFLKAQFPAS